MSKFWILMLTLTGIQKIEGGLDQLKLVPDNEQTLFLLQKFADENETNEQYPIVCNL